MYSLVASMGSAVAGMTSRKGRSHTFDERADGYGRGEACGSASLQLLPTGDDGAKSIALHGCAVRQDGRSASLTAPNGSAQQALIRAAVADAGATADDMAVLEAHGTGTPLGDPIEASSLSAAILEEHDNDDMLAAGSGKANVGHTEPAAGMTGIVRLAPTITATVSTATVATTVATASFPTAVSSTALATTCRTAALPASIAAAALAAAIAATALAAAGTTASLSSTLSAAAVTSTFSSAPFTPTLTATTALTTAVSTTALSAAVSAAAFSATITTTAVSAALATASLATRPRNVCARRATEHAGRSRAQSIGHGELTEIGQVSCTSSPGPPVYERANARVTAYLSDGTAHDVSERRRSADDHAAPVHERFPERGDDHGHLAQLARLLPSLWHALGDAQRGQPGGAARVRHQPRARRRPDARPGGGRHARHGRDAHLCQRRGARPRVGDRLARSAPPSCSTSTAASRRASPSTASASSRSSTTGTSRRSPRRCAAATCSRASS